MKRVSLQKKIDHCQKIGTLKTYTLEEAIGHFTKNCTPHFVEELSGLLYGVMAAYEKGKYLCGFVVHPDNEERFDTVYQLNTLPNFIKDIVYFMITD